MGRAKDFIMGLPHGAYLARLEQLGFKTRSVRYYPHDDADMYRFEQAFVGSSRLSFWGVLQIGRPESEESYHALFVSRFGDVEDDLRKYSADPEWLLQLLDYLVKVEMPEGENRHWTLAFLVGRWVAANPNPKPRLF